ncbi:MAG TPA: hypothetical protein VFU38_09630, partial [Candidatus Krumholzibacteria bacterium]|nr:hypothetical protein [Candidatus Krumholzibacteria bacterium]
MARSRCAGFLFALPMLMSVPSFATVIHVPGDYATIQAAIDAAVVGDVVEVACGTYQVPEIIMKSGIGLRSATGQADCVVLEPAAGPNPRRLLRCVVDNTTEIRGITFRDGYDIDFSPIYIEGSPQITRCHFLSNIGRALPVQVSHDARLDASACTIFGAAVVLQNSSA